MSVTFCASCRFFEPRFFNGEPSRQNGYCRRRAPRPWTSRHAEEEQRDAWWPLVATDDWCGEYQPDPKEPRP